MEASPLLNDDAAAVVAWRAAAAVSTATLGWGATATFARAPAASARASSALAAVTPGRERRRPRREVGQRPRRPHLERARRRRPAPEPAARGCGRASRPRRPTRCTTTISRASTTSTTRRAGARGAQRSRRHDVDSWWCDGVRAAPGRRAAAAGVVRLRLRATATGGRACSWIGEAQSWCDRLARNESLWRSRRRSGRAAAGEPPAARAELDARRPRRTGRRHRRRGTVAPGPRRRRSRPTRPTTGRVTPRRTARCASSGESAPPVARPTRPESMASSRTGRARSGTPAGLRHAHVAALRVHVRARAASSRRTRPAPITRQEDAPGIRGNRSTEGRGRKRWRRRAAVACGGRRGGADGRPPIACTRSWRSSKTRRSTRAASTAARDMARKPRREPRRAPRRERVAKRSMTRRLDL